MKTTQRDLLRQVAIVQWRKRNDSGPEAIASVADAVAEEMDTVTEEAISVLGRLAERWVNRIPVHPGADDVEEALDLLRRLGRCPPPGPRTTVTPEES